MHIREKSIIIKTIVLIKKPGKSNAIPGVSHTEIGSDYKTSAISFQGQIAALIHYKKIRCKSMLCPM